MKRWAKSNFTVKDNKVLLDTFGIYLRKQEQNIFGHSPPLEANAESKGANTPLVETGELKSKVAYKNSIDKQIKEG